MEESITININAESYEDYLSSEDWHKLKKASYRIYGFKCINCGCVHRKNLQSHHLIYKKNRRDVKPEMVIPLCRECHTSFHNQFPVKDNLNLFAGEISDVRDKTIFTLRSLGRKNPEDIVDYLLKLNNKRVQKEHSKKQTQERRFLRKKKERLMWMRNNHPIIKAHKDYPR